MLMVERAVALPKEYGDGGDLVAPGGEPVQAKVLHEEEGAERHGRKIPRGGGDEVMRHACAGYGGEGIGGEGIGAEAIEGLTQEGIIGAAAANPVATICGKTITWTRSPEPSWTSFEPTRTSIFPYDLPPIKVHTYAINGTNATTSSGTDAVATTTVTATPAVAAGDPLHSMMSALNINVSAEHMQLFPTQEPGFQDAADEVVRLVDGRQMRGLPLEIEVSPGHMPSVWTATERMNKLQLKGTQQDLVELYFIWIEFLDELLLPPTLRESDAHFTKDELRQYYHDLYEAWYMPRVRSVKMALSHAPKHEDHEPSGKTSKSFTMFYTHWEIRASNLHEVDQLPGHKTNRPGHGLHKLLKKCGAVTSWRFMYGAQEVLDCSQGFVPYDSKDPSAMSKEEKKKAKKEWKQEKKRRKHPKKVPARKPRLTDMGTNIQITEPLPPVQDDDQMSWWRDTGHSGCREDWEQAPKMGDYETLYGTAISHKPRTTICHNYTITEHHRDSNKKNVTRCNTPAWIPEDNIVTRNGTDYLHINFYAWAQNVQTRITQLQADKVRRDSGAFTATFNLPVAQAHCVKGKLHEMGWTQNMHVKNKTNWAVFTFELLTTVIFSAIPMWGVGGAMGAAVGAAVAEGAGEAAAEVAAGAVAETLAETGTEVAADSVIMSTEGGAAEVVPEAAAKAIEEGAAEDGTSSVLNEKEKAALARARVSERSWLANGVKNGVNIHDTRALQYLKWPHSQAQAYKYAAKLAKEVGEDGAAAGAAAGA